MWDFGTEGDYRWHSATWDWHGIEFEGWIDGQPDLSGTCVAMTTRDNQTGWDDTDCYDGYALCQFDAQ